MGHTSTECTLRKLHDSISKRRGIGGNNNYRGRGRVHRSRKENGTSANNNRYQTNQLNHWNNN